MKSEAEVSDDVVIETSKYGLRLFRNNSGAFKDSRGVPVRFGLGNVSKRFNKLMKTSDYIGWTPVVSTPEMVGKTVAVFTALEIKEADWKYSGDEREVAQKKFIDLVNNSGGIASFIKSVEQVKQLVFNYFSNDKTN